MVSSNSGRGSQSSLYNLRGCYRKLSAKNDSGMRRRLGRLILCSRFWRDIRIGLGMSLGLRALELVERISPVPVKCVLPSLPLPSLPPLPSLLSPLSHPPSY